MQNPVETKPESFEDTYKKAYSHGLESIYALEAVDPKTIRPMSGGAIHSPASPPINVEKRESFSFDPQLEIDLGAEYRSWMLPFFPREPIQALNLSLLVEKALVSNGKKKIADLLELSVQDLVHLKGVGQGHLQEIQHTLNQYIDGRPLDRACHVDFLGWLRSLVGGEDRKKVKVALEPYRLDGAITLSHAEELEVRKLTVEARREWMEDVYQKISFYSMQMQVESDLMTITATFLKPWMRGRLGLASHDELMERLECVAEAPALATPVLNFIHSVYFSDRPLLDRALISLDKGIYCSDLAVASMYRTIIKKAKTYFYSPKASYSLPELALLLYRELAAEWVSIPEGFIEKTLRYSPQFCVRKNCRGTLIVMLM